MTGSSLLLPALSAPQLRGSGACVRISPDGAAFDFWSHDAELFLQIDADQAEALADGLRNPHDQPLLQFRGQVTSLPVASAAIFADDDGEVVAHFERWRAEVTAARDAVDVQERVLDRLQVEERLVFERRRDYLPACRRRLPNGELDLGPYAAQVLALDAQLAELTAEVAAARQALDKCQQAVDACHLAMPPGVLSLLQKLDAGVAAAAAAEAQATARLNICNDDIAQAELTLLDIAERKIAVSKAHWAEAAAKGVDDDERIMADLEQALSGLDKAGAEAAVRLERCRLMHGGLQSLVAARANDHQAAHAQADALGRWAAGLFWRVEVARIKSEIEGLLSRETVILAALQRHNPRFGDLGETIRKLLAEAAIEPDPTALKFLHQRAPSVPVVSATQNAAA